MTDKLSENQLAALRYIHREYLMNVYGINGELLANVLETSPQGAHQTAASLVRRRLLTKGLLGPRGHVVYNITRAGVAVLTKPKEKK